MARRLNARNTAVCALFTAMMCASALFTVPLPVTPVPVTLQTCVVLLAALCLPKREAFVSVLAYVLLGAAGLPVFSGGRAGLAVLTGPTGGFIASFPLTAYCVSALFPILRNGAFRNRLKPAAAVVSAVCGTAVTYSFGCAWFAVLTGTDLGSAFVLCAAPFIPGDVLKTAGAILIHNATHKIGTKIGAFK